MKSSLHNIRTRRFAGVGSLVAGFAISIGALSAAQQPAPNGVEIQRDAMHKLAFLAGRWSGPVTIVRGPAQTIHLTQSEDVQYKLDGLVMLVEGESQDADGKASFRALATISFDDATHAYRFRAYHDGHYIDSELTVVANGFSWGFTAGPAHITNTMHLTDKGEWAETTDVTMGDNPAFRSLDMLLHHQP